LLGGGAATVAVTPYLTSADANLAAQPDIAVVDGAFSASLDGQTVTTFVGRSRSARSAHLGGVAPPAGPAEAERHRQEASDQQGCIWAAVVADVARATRFTTAAGGRRA